MLIERLIRPISRSDSSPSFCLRLVRPVRLQSPSYRVPLRGPNLWSLSTAGHGPLLFQMRSLWSYLVLSFRIDSKMRAPCVGSARNMCFQLTLPIFPACFALSRRTSSSILLPNPQPRSGTNTQWWLYKSMDMRIQPSFSSERLATSNSPLPPAPPLGRVAVVGGCILRAPKLQDSEAKQTSGPPASLPSRRTDTTT